MFYYQQLLKNVWRFQILKFIPSCKGKICSIESFVSKSGIWCSINGYTYNIKEIK